MELTVPRLTGGKCTPLNEKTHKKEGNDTMKKWIAILATVLTIATVTACGANKDEQISSGTSSSSYSEVSFSDTVQESQTENTNSSESSSETQSGNENSSENSSESQGGNEDSSGKVVKPITGGGNFNAGGY